MFISAVQLAKRCRCRRTGRSLCCRCAQQPYQEGAMMVAQRKNRKPITLAAGVAIIVALTAAGLSQAGRHSVQKLVAAITGATPSAPQIQAATTTTPDVEQRARSHHGWSTSVLDAVQQGSIAFYDGSGAVSRQGTLLMYHKFP